MTAGRTSVVNWPGAHQLDWRGHGLLLLPERALWDPQQELLLLADVHLGKAEAFQANGIPLPSDGDHGNLNRLLALAHGLQPRRLIVLGDLIHHRLGLSADLRQKLQALPALLGCPLELVGGNHDRGSWLEQLPALPSISSGPLWLSHEPEPPPAGQLNLCGHLHPVALLGAGAIACGCPASPSIHPSGACCCPPSASSPAAIPARQGYGAGWWPMARC